MRVCAEHLRRYNEGLQLSNVIRMRDALEVLSAFQEEEKMRKEAPEEETPIQVTDTERFLFKLFRGIVPPPSDWLLLSTLLLPSTGVCRGNNVYLHSIVSLWLDGF